MSSMITSPAKWLHKIYGEHWTKGQERKMALKFSGESPVTIDDLIMFQAIEPDIDIERMVQFFMAARRRFKKRNKNQELLEILEGL